MAQPGQGFNQNTLNDVLGTVAGVSSLLSGTILRDYTHAAKTFRTNSYQYSPKLKFLFHTYFDLNVSLDDDQTNFGLLVKEVKLPSFTFQNAQMNQYNRKRIVQTKIKYEPIEISFHDDNGNQATKLWEAYYQYYYNDSTKPGSVLSGPGAGPTGVNNYNARNIYETSITGDDDWGFSGGQSDAETGVKIPFFKNITVFGFNQHNFTAYTLINPVIVNFAHDTYNYAEGGGTMTNRMTIDYETVVYNYGAMDGRNPGNIVAGFGDPAHYDTLPSPIAGQGRGTILGQGGLVDAAGGAIKSLAAGNIVGAVANAMSAYNSINQVTQPGGLNVGTEAVNAALRTSLGNNPQFRNALFSIPIAGSSPGQAFLANSPTTGVKSNPSLITQDAVQTGTNGLQYSATTPTGKIVAPNLNDPENTVLEVVPQAAGTQYAGNNLAFPLGSLTPDLPFGITGIGTA